MRSILLHLAVLAASVMAAPKPEVDCVTNGNTVIEYTDITITETVYVTEGAVPAPTYTTRRKHTHPSPVYTPVYTPVYVPPPPPSPTEDVVTIIYGYEPPPPPSPTPQQQQQQPEQPPSASGNFIDDCLNTHNNYRAIHGAPPVTWNDQLASYAEGNTGDCVMQHTGGPYGENLAMGYSDPVSAITDWYNEGNQYDYSAPGFDGSTGHFTQVVWKDTSEIGCYLRQCGSGGYLMCEYQAAGNVVGDNGAYFIANVLPPQ